MIVSEIMSDLLSDSAGSQGSAPYSHSIVPGGFEVTS